MRRPLTRRLLAALAGLLILPCVLAQGRTVSFAAALNLERAAFEATLHEPIVGLGDWTAVVVTSAQLRAVDPFTDPALQAALVTGFGMQSCGPGHCWSADLRYKVLLQYGAPIVHGPDLTVGVSIGLMDPPAEPFPAEADDAKPP